jgi:hypothetical protein
VTSAITDRQFSLVAVRTALTYLAYEGCEVVVFIRYSSVPRGLMHGYVAVRLPGLWVGIPPGA